MQPNWTVSTTRWKKNVPICREIKCSSIKTMRAFTHAQLPVPNSMNSITNCFRINQTLQIWPLRLLSLSKFEKMASWKEISVERGFHRWIGGLFQGPRRIVLFGGHRKIGGTLDKVYRAKRRLYWEIKWVFHQKKAFCSTRSITFQLTSCIQFSGFDSANRTQSE